MKANLEILRVAVLNKEDARTPTKLTVSYKGWWHTPLLHVPLAMEPLRDGVHATRKDGKITLVQRFASGKAPTFRVKGRSNKLVIRLYARRTLRTRAQVEVGPLVCSTAEKLVKVPFEVKVDGKVEKAFLVVAQTSPVPTPPPPAIYPVGHKLLSSPPVPKCTFPLGEYEPSQGRLKLLVEEMCGPMPDPREWLVPASPPGARCTEEEATPLPLPDPGEWLVSASPPRALCSEAEATLLPLPDSGEWQVSTSPPGAGCTEAEATPLLGETDDKADVVSDKCEANSVEMSSDGLEQESEAAEMSPQTSPRTAGDHYVRLWSEVFGEVQNVSATRTDTVTPSRRNASLTPPRGAAKRTPPRVASVVAADQPAEVSARCVRLWNEVFGELQ